MKNVIYLIFFSLLIVEINLNLFLVPSSENNEFDYSTIKSIVTNENVNNSEYIATESDQSVLYYTEYLVGIWNANIIKTGASSNLNNSEFYGVNSAILINGGWIDIWETNITTSSEGSNAVACTNFGLATLNSSLISTTSDFSRGFLSTFEGVISGYQIRIETRGRSSACLATDKGESIVYCQYCSMQTRGVGSPIIYSNGDGGGVGAYNSNGTALNSQIAVIEGKNDIYIDDNSFLMASGNGGMNDNCGILIYQSQPGDPNITRSFFHSLNSYFQIMPNSSVYSTAPFFFVTNTQTNITLENCHFLYGSGVFLKASQNSHWGTIGENGADVLLNLVNQTIEGDFVVDSNSELTINMTNSTIKGKINNNRAASAINIILDSYSKIDLTGNSYYSTIENEDTTGSNINNGSFSLSYYNDTIKIINDNTNNGLILNNNFIKLYILSFLIFIL